MGILGFSEGRAETGRSSLSTREEHVEKLGAQGFYLKATGLWSQKCIVEAVTKALAEHSSRAWPGRLRQTVYSLPGVMSICSEKEKLQLVPGQEGKHTCPLLYAISL